MRKSLLFSLLICGLMGAGTWLFSQAQEKKDPASEKSALQVGAAAVDIDADDSMVIAGGIGGVKLHGQEGKLRAVAVVLQNGGGDKVAVVACDVLFVQRDFMDPIVEEIEKSTGIPAANILVNATHTHHAPSTTKIHGYDRDEIFVRRLQRAIVKAVQDANAKLGDASFYFRLGEESSVGQNSRLLLGDNTIYWTGSMADAVRPTGPFDPELPVFAFRDSEKKLKALIFNHSTHTIGAREAGKRSPGFYGLAAQELESELGGTVCFLEGASGSTHNLTLKANEMITRIKNAVKDALDQAEPRPVVRLKALKRKFTFRVRRFDEAKEEAAVSYYCTKRMPTKEWVEKTSGIFREMRKELAPHQGEERASWVQTLLIGDVAIVGVPAEFFTKLGEDIKRRSPFRYTYVAELANDWIGYLPDRKAHELGGYQTWTGLHSYAEPGTGEAVVKQAVEMLREMK